MATVFLMSMGPVSGIEVASKMFAAKPGVYRVTLTQGWLWADFAEQLIADGAFSEADAVAMFELARCSPKAPANVCGWLFTAPPGLRLKRKKWRSNGARTAITIRRYLRRKPVRK